MLIRVCFHSYFKDLTGCEETLLEAELGTKLGDLLELTRQRFPKLVAMRKSTLTAVGVEYQDAGYLLQEGDEVSLFPPVQGGAGSGVMEGGD